MITNNGAENVQGTESATETTVASKPVKKVKKAAKKKPAKKAAKKAVKKERKERTLKEPLAIKAGSMSDAVKQFMRSGEKRATLSVNGKKYGATRRSTWCVSKSLFALGAAGIVMVIEGEGYYVYPASKYNELFGAIMKSETYKKIGSYSQSGLPVWHEEYFNAK